MKIEDKIYLLGYDIDEEGSHLGVKNPDECKRCKQKQCTYVCPAKVYEYDEKQGFLSINYDACVECGTCRIACNNIKWRYPRGGFGVSYKFG